MGDKGAEAQRRSEVSRRKRILALARKLENNGSEAAERELRELVCACSEAAERQRRKLRGLTEYPIDPTPLVVSHPRIVDGKVILVKDEFVLEATSIDQALQEESATAQLGKSRMSEMNERSILEAAMRIMNGIDVLECDERELCELFTEVSYVWDLCVRAMELRGVFDPQTPILPDLRPESLFVGHALLGEPLAPH